MKYYVKCNNVFNRNKVEMIGEDEIPYFSIKHTKLPKIYGMNITDLINGLKYKVSYNPLRFKKRFQLLDSNKQQVMAISVGLKYLHKIEYNNKVFSCKGSLWKIRYKLYDIDTVVATLKVVKINKERYYLIDLADNKNILIALAMLVIAQSIRERLFII
ncbi:MAG: hypothetical protein KAJ22_04300 [Candidatus Izimaplasma sp.]|nr:hypothetical protein [Candidatus Izimaplasma bacterium]